MTDVPEISAIMTAHAEGVLVGPSLSSFERAIDTAREAGLTVESLIVLDRPDDATRLQFADRPSPHRLVESDQGDPGLARNVGVSMATGRYVTFLDGDDLWSPNRLAAAHRFCAADPEHTVAHSEANIIFGQVRQMWWHVDSRDPEFDPGFLQVGNYWDAMSFASRRLFERWPFRANDLARGFGHEDWHWNCLTLAAGVAHRPVPGTFHFKRRRGASQMTLCDAVDAIPWATPIASYGWQPAEPGGITS